MSNTSRLCLSANHVLCVLPAVVMPKADRESPSQSRVFTVAMLVPACPFSVLICPDLLAEESRRSWKGLVPLPFSCTHKGNGVGYADPSHMFASTLGNGGGDVLKQFAQSELFSFLFIPFTTFTGIGLRSCSVQTFAKECLYLRLTCLIMKFFFVERNSPALHGLSVQWCFCECTQFDALLPWQLIGFVWVVQFY